MLRIKCILVSSESLSRLPSLNRFVDKPADLVGDEFLVLPDRIDISTTVLKQIENKGCFAMSDVLARPRKELMIIARKKFCPRAEAVRDLFKAMQIIARRIVGSVLLRANVLQNKADSILGSVLES